MHVIAPYIINPKTTPNQQADSEYKKRNKKIDISKLENYNILILIERLIDTPPSSFGGNCTILRDRAFFLA